MLDMALLADEMAAIVDEAVERAVRPWAERVAVLERRTVAEALSDDAKAALLADWQRHMDSLPQPETTPSVTVEDLHPIITAAVAEAVAALPAPQPGKSVDPAEVEAMVQKAVDAIPAPENGTSVTVEDVRPLIADEVDRAVSALPPAKPGEPADPEVTRQMIAEAVAALPPAVPGKSVTATDVEPMLTEMVSRAVSALPKPKDGVGLAGALIDRKGALIVTLSDGTLTELGQVEGKNGDPGIGFDDLTFEYDGERALTLKLVRGDQVKAFPITVPVMIDRGVYREGQTYERGDTVTFGGSLWIAQKATSEKPDGPDTGWRLAVKKGRDAREPAKA